MSKKRRHSNQSVDVSQIEWLKSRSGFPSAEEREKIIEMRLEILFQYFELNFRDDAPDSPRWQALYDKYGQAEVDRAEREILRTFTEGISLPADDARAYRDYRLRYSRYGAGLKFYSSKEVNELSGSSFKADRLRKRRRKPEFFSPEIEKALLLGWRMWEDITPLAPPPRPADFFAPQPGSYPAPVAEALEWGDDLDYKKAFADEAEVRLWRRHISDITRMALDPGLLGGWPSEKPSWAPWHALRLLGDLQAFDSAYALAQLADMENDWLSDHLPRVWAKMGLEVEAVLWMIFEDSAFSVKKRALAAEGLSMLATEYSLETKAAEGFVKTLQNRRSFDPTLNAYLVHFLWEMDEAENHWEEVARAFEENRVDTTIITLKELEEELEEEMEEDFD